MAGTVIVLFTDVVGSTELLTELGDEAFDDVRREHFEVLERQVDAHGGELVKRLGDGVMTVFGSASDAISAAVAMQRAVDAASGSHNGGVSVRIGVAAGDAAEEDGDWYGAPVVEASRLCAAADAGQILTSEVVRMLAGSRGGHEYRPVGELELKGLPDRVAASEVGWTRAITAAAVPLPGPFAPAEGELPFSGRDEQLVALRHEWKAAVADDGRVVNIAGEPGVGKSRLVAELARGVHDDGAVVLLGRTDEYVDAPFAPWREALRWLVRHVSDTLLAEHVAQHGGELARIVPELSRRIDRLPEPAAVDPETDRLLLFDAVAGMLAATSQVAPVLLVLDDLHWADQPTLLLLLHVLRTDLDARLLVVTTHRDTDVDRAHPLAGVLADLRRARGATRLNLDGLDSDGVADLLVRTGGHDLDEREREFAVNLHTETEGNPFFVVEVLRHLAESGALVQEDGRWRAAGDPEEIGLPEGVREVIGRRLEVLGDDTNRILGVAAVIGREFEVGLAATVAEIAPEAVLDALEPAEQARLIAEVPGAPGRYGFAHALVQSVLVEELGTNRRIRLHRAAGRALEAHTDAPLQALAYHFGEAAVMGETEAAMRYAREAAEEAILLGAPEQAIAMARRALDAAELGDVAALERVPMLLVFARAIYAAGDFAEGLNVTAEAFDIAISAGDLDQAGQAAIEFGGPMGVWENASDDRGPRQLRAVLDALSPGDSAQRAILMARLALWLVIAPGDEVRRVAQEAYDMAQRVGDPGARLDAAAGVALASRNLDYRRQITLADETDELLGAAGQLTAQISGYGTRAEALLGLGDLAGVDTTIERTAIAMRAQGLHHLLFLGETWWSLRALLDGDFDDAARRCDELDASRTEQKWPHLAAAVQRAVLNDLRGDWFAAYEWMTKAFAAEPIVFAPYFPFYMEVVCDLDEVRAEWEGRRELAPLLPDWTRPPNIFALSPALRVLGEADEARELHDQFADRAGEWIVNGYLWTGGPFDYPLGILADAAGDLDAAIDHSTAAIESCVRAGSQSFAVRPRVDLVSALRRRHATGDSARADAVDAEARHYATEIGQPGWIRRLDRIADGDLNPWREL